MVLQSTSYGFRQELTVAADVLDFNSLNRKIGGRNEDFTGTSFGLFHDGDTGRGLEMKQGLSQGQVLLPISEAIFQFDSAGLHNANVRQFSTLGIDFQQHLIELVFDRGYRSFEVIRGGFGLRFLPAGKASQDDVAARPG